MAKRRRLQDMVYEGMPFDEAIVHLYVEEGLRLRDIAERFSVTPSAILLHLERLRVERRQGGYRPGHVVPEEVRSKISSRLRGRNITWRDKVAATRRARNYSGARSGRWRGGRKLRADGYVYVMVKGHPHANTDGYVMQHILVMEQVLGRYLRPGETVHHINRIRSDNRPENLHLFATPNEHMAYHARERWAQKHAK